MSTTVTKVNNIADLLAQSPSDGDLFEVAGYYEPGDRGGGLWRWVEDDTTQPNYGSVIGVWVPAPGPDAYESGRYFLVHDGVVNVRQFGALGDGDGTTLYSQIGTRWEDETHIANTYGDQTDGSVPTGTPFSGFFHGSGKSETADWAAVQVAIQWCAENGVRLEAPSGEYVCRRPLWLGDDRVEPELVDETYIDTGKDVRQMGFTFVGQTSNSRREADGYPDEEVKGGVANIRLSGDCTNRYCLSFDTDDPPAGTFQIALSLAGGEYTVGDFGVTSTATDVLDAINTQFETDDPQLYVAVLDVPDPGATIPDQNVYFQVLQHHEGSDPTQIQEFLGEGFVQTSDETPAPYYWARCLPDCAVLSFRRSAGVRMRVENLTLKGNNDPDNDNDTRYASFGFLFTTSQFNGHVLERHLVSFCDTVVGLLQGTGANGEWTRVSRVACENCRRGYYSKRPRPSSRSSTVGRLGWTTPESTQSSPTWACPASESTS